MNFLDEMIPLFFIQNFVLNIKNINVLIEFCIMKKIYFEKFKKQKSNFYLIIFIKLIHYYICK